MSDITLRKNEDETVQEFRADPGPVVLDLTASGRITITVDERATHAYGVIRTAAKSGPYADAVRNTTVERSGRRLIVRVPETGGGTVIQGNNIVITGGSMNFTGGRTYINGWDVTDQVRGGVMQDDVEIHITLPPGSWVRMDIQSGKARILGAPLESLEVRASSGSVEANEVGDLEVDASTGNYSFRRVTGKLDVHLSSGKLNVGAYEGSRGKVRISSGHVMVHATPNSSGEFETSTSSGSLTLTGSRHLDTSRRRCSSGHLSIS